MAYFLTMKPEILRPHSVFVFHGFLPHVGSEYLGHDNLCFHVYLSPADLDLQYSISFAYQWCLNIANKHMEEEKYTHEENLNISPILPED